MPRFQASISYYIGYEEIENNHQWVGHLKICFLDSPNLGFTHQHMTWGIRDPRLGKVARKNLVVFGRNCQWIGLRENLQETIDFPIKYGAFL